MGPSSGSDSIGILRVHNGTLLHVPTNALRDRQLNTLDAPRLRPLPYFNYNVGRPLHSGLCTGCGCGLFAELRSVPPLSFDDDNDPVVASFLTFHLPGFLGFA